MGLVPLRVCSSLGQENRLEVGHDTLVVQSVRVAHISRQIPVVAHQPHLPIVFMSYHTTGKINKQTNKERQGEIYLLNRTVIIRAVSTYRLLYRFGCTYIRACIISRTEGTSTDRPSGTVNTHRTHTHRWHSCIQLIWSKQKQRADR